MPCILHPRVNRIAVLRRGRRRIEPDSLDAWRTRQYDYYQRVLNGIL
jgi:hypothetical protein